MNYISVKEAADRWCLSTSRVRSMCAAGQIPGVLKPGKAYMIPDSALKPADGRRLRGRDINPLYTKMFAQVDAYRQALEEIRPLRLQEFIRWQEKEMAGFIYNSAALEGNRITSQETRLLLSGGSVGGKPLRDNLEILFHREALYFLAEALYAKIELSRELAEEIQALLVWEQPGAARVYREHKREEFAALLAGFNNSRCHPLEEVAAFHLQMLVLQPFKVANNLTARILVNFMLMRNCYPPITITMGDRHQYDMAVQTYLRQHTEFLMVELICRKVSVQLTKGLVEEPEEQKVQQLTLWEDE